MTRESDSQVLARERTRQQHQRAVSIRRREQDNRARYLVYAVWAVIIVIGLICLAAGIR